MSEMKYKMTPAMQQLHSIKQQYPDCIIFFRIGDFYETFGEDAIITSKVTGMVLTKRDKSEDAPFLCGAPYHSVDRYLKMMVDAGYKVAIVEQMEDASMAKGIVKREVVRIVTKGTLEEGDINALNENKYIASIVEKSDEIALSYCDIYSGECKATLLKNCSDLISNLYKLQPMEILIFASDNIYLKIKELFNAHIVKIDKNHDESLILEYFNVVSIKSVGLINNINLIASVANLLHYIKYTFKKTLKNISYIKVYDAYNVMMLDESTINNLNILKGSDGTKEGSLLSIIDHTVTAMGKRRLRYEIVHPLLSVDEITKRHNFVESLMNNMIVYYEIKRLLSQMYDINRIISKIARGSASHLDLLALANTLKLYLDVKSLVNDVCKDN